MREFLPARLQIDARERVRVVAGSFVGLLVTGLLCKLLLPPGSTLPWLFAPLGASAVLVFAVPSSPLAQPWAAVGGNTLSALVGIAFASATGRRYPHGQQPAAPAPQPTAARPQVNAADVDAVLRRHNEIVDIGRADLQDILEEAELQAHRRRLGSVRCADIMSRGVEAAEYGTLLQDAWATLRTRRIKALPVIDRARRVVGIVTLNDFMKGAELDLHDGWAQRLRTLIRATPATHSDKPEVVGQIMTRQVRVASADRPIGELVPLFADTGHHHIPIIDDEQRLVGIITQSDLVAALSRA